ncbi:MAG TPA: hypothetical protein VGZ22_22965 [Isosphaeraceae bacterium]|jgi:hypothetical protein|nr:hypothetical protein [Isosphaeraceae bacterium]
MVDKCSDILSRGVFNKFSLATESEYASQLKAIFSHSYDEIKSLVEKKDGKVGISIPIAGALLGLNASGGMSRETYERLREDFYSSTDASTQQKAMTTINSYVADPGIVSAWRHCMEKEFDQAPQIGVSYKVNGPIDGEFQLFIRYIPAADTDPADLVLSDVDFPNSLAPFGELKLTKGAKIHRNTPSMQKFINLNPYVASYIVLSFQGHQDITVGIPAKPQLPAGLKEAAERAVDKLATASLRQRDKLSQIQSMPNQIHDSVPPMIDDGNLYATEAYAWMMGMYKHIKAVWLWEPPEGGEKQTAYWMAAVDGGKTRAQKCEEARQAVFGNARSIQEKATALNDALSTTKALSEDMSNAIADLQAIREAVDKYEKQLEEYRNG